eukprot:6491080-Amphidinium_carterae.2
MSVLDLHYCVGGYILINQHSALASGEQYVCVCGNMLCHRWHMNLLMLWKFYWPGYETQQLVKTESACTCYHLQLLVECSVEGKHILQQTLGDMHMFCYCKSCEPMFSQKC